MNLLEKTENVLSFMYNGKHHIPEPMKDEGVLVSIRIPAGISTYDFNMLTRLVLTAHKYCVRVTIWPSTNRRLLLHFHDRKTDINSGICDYHPDINGMMDFAKKELGE